MMKTIITILILAFATVVWCQNINFNDTNCLAIVKLKYQILDSNAINAIEYPLTNSKYQNILSYSSKKSIKLAYYTKNKNKWISIELPFSEATNDFSFISSDTKGESKLIIKGMVSNSEKRGRSEHRTHTYVMLIINISSVPTQIFKVNYGCDESEIPYDGAKETAYYYHTYERKIEVTEKGLTISSPDKKEFSTDDCHLTEIKDGTYIFNETGINLNNSKKK